MSSFIFDAIGTHWTIDIYTELAKDIEEKIYAHIRERISVFDQVYSRFREDSVVTEMSRKPGRYVLPDDAQDMFAAYRTMYDITGGLFTPLIGNVLSDAGYDASYSLTQKKPLDTPLSWDKAMSYAHPYIDIHVPVLLDFGAAGKGYLIDLVGNVLEEHGIDSYCIDAGGDMLYKNTNNTPLVVGLEHPDLPIMPAHAGQAGDIAKVIGTVSIRNQSLCGSAGNRRTWEQFHHVINPDTLVSPRHIRAIWAIADNTLIADALTTALYFVSSQKLAEHFSFEYCILNDDYSVERSEGFNAEIFS